MRTCCLPYTVQIVKDKGGQGEQIDGLGKSTGEVKNIFENILVQIISSI